METPINLIEEITTITVGEEIISITVNDITTVIETETQWPPWPPWTWADPADFSREHIQTIASNVWTINHNLGFKPNIQIEDSAGDSVIPQKIIQNSINQILVEFQGAMAGKAYLS